MRIRSTLPNMATMVSGVCFSPASDDNGWISEEVSEDVAIAFADVPGYCIDNASSPNPVVESATAEPDLDARRNARKTEKANESKP